jgi:NAD(P)-dependent dehydrogenase (short-subunit alcohol dehydrogenase family)
MTTENAAATDPSGRNALIMGAAGILPGAIALRLAVAGADIALTTATPDAEEAFELRHLSSSIRELGRRCLVESVDMSLATNVQVAVRQVTKVLGSIDLLVLAPDFRLDKPAERLSDAEWARLIGLNLSSVFFAGRAVAREMQRREPDTQGVRGRIVVVSRESVGQGAAYRAAKAGAVELVAGLRDEWASQGLAVALLLVTDESEAAAAKAGNAVLQLATASIGETAAITTIES